MPIHVQTPEGDLYQAIEAPFGGVVLKPKMPFFLLSDYEPEEDIYDACALKLPTSSYTRTECFFDPYEETERGEE